MLERAPSRTRRRAGFPARDVAALAELVRARVARKRARPLLVGLTGLPGSGKSTLAAQLASELRAGGIATLVLALDDFYLGRAARAKLARHVHPLFATRGPAGTHDIECLAALLDAAASGGGAREGGEAERRGHDARRARPLPAALRALGRARVADFAWDRRRRVAPRSAPPAGQVCSNR